jgi:hypothetical protein
MTLYDKHLQFANGTQPAHDGCMYNNEKWNGPGEGDTESIAAEITHGELSQSEKMAAAQQLVRVAIIILGTNPSRLNLGFTSNRFN